MQKVIAWIKKYIFHVKSPYARLFGYDYEWDFLKYAIWDGEEIIVDERYHTCGRCVWEDLSDDYYPCNQCIHGTDRREDFWKLKEEVNADDNN